MMKLLKFTSLLLTLILSQATAASLLYSWTHKDGTPTFSPDPPPKGVPYIIVGPDLQPLQDQSAGNANQPGPSTATPSAATNALATQPPVKKAGDIVMTPAPGSLNPANAHQTTTAGQAATTAANSAQPTPDWKPVKYADDPNPGANQPVFSTSSANETATGPAVPQASAACIKVKKNLFILESQFANAVTAKEMDTAVVRLNAFRKQNKGSCGL